MFLWHFPSSCPDRTLSCTLPDGARTFLDASAPRRSSVLRALDATPAPGATQAAALETGFRLKESRRGADAKKDAFEIGALDRVYRSAGFFAGRLRRRGKFYAHAAGSRKPDVGTHRIPDGVADTVA
jgi:hypothetical protein